MKKSIFFPALLLVHSVLSAHQHVPGKQVDSAHQYLLIVRYNPNIPKLSDEALKTNSQHWGGWIGQLAQSGKLVTGYRPVTEGKTISGHTRAAQKSPYAGDKEVVSSIFIIRAADMDEASAIADGCPIYETDGSIEIRLISDTAHDKAGQ